MEPIFPEKSCNMDASLDNSSEADMIQSASDYMFLPNTTQGLTESDIAKNIKRNVMMNEAHDDKSTIFSFINESSPGKKDSFVMDDTALLMVNENSLDTFESAKLIMTGKDTGPDTELLHRSASSLDLIDPYGSYPGTGPPQLDMDLLSEPTSGRGTPVLFRKFDIAAEKDSKEVVKFINQEKEKYVGPFLPKIPIVPDDIMDNFTDLPESRCVKPSDVQSQAVKIKIEPRESTEVEKSRQRKLSGSKKVPSVKPKIAIQDQSGIIPSSPVVTSSFVININNSLAKIAPKAGKKIPAPKLPVQNSVPVQSQQLSRLRLQHPIITGILGIPTKGPVWQIPNLFGPGLMHNQPHANVKKNKELPCIVLEKSKSSDSIEETAVTQNQSVKDTTVLGTVSEGNIISKTPPATVTSPKRSSPSSLTSVKLRGQGVQSKSNIQGILVTDDTTFIYDKNHSVENQVGPTKKSNKETVAQLAIKKLLTAKTTELYKGTSLQLTLPITPESEGEEQGLGLDMDLTAKGDSSEDSHSPRINQTLVDNYMQNWKPTGKYSCTECPYSSVTRNYLFRHWVMRHTSIKPYQCPYCDTDMGYKDGIVRHQVSNHRGKPRNVLVDYELENKLIEEFSAIFGENVIDPAEKVAIRDRTNTDVDIPISECSIVQNIPGNQTVTKSFGNQTVTKSKSTKKTIQNEIPKGISQSTLASISLPILPAIVNTDSIAISAAVALQSAVLSLTQAGTGNAKSSSAKSQTVCTLKQPVLSTQVKNVSGPRPVFVIPDEANVELCKNQVESDKIVTKVDTGIKRSRSDTEPVLFKISRVESLGDKSTAPSHVTAVRTLTSKSSDSPITCTLNKETAHTAVKS